MKANLNITFYKEEKFKETPIGKIPEDWDVKRLENIAENIYYGITAKAVEDRTNLRILRTTDIKDYHVDWNSLPFCKVTEKRNKLDKYLLRKGDLIVARAGTTGVSVLVEKDFNDVIFGSYLIKIRLKENLLPKFIHYFFQSSFYWNHIISSQAGSTLKNISLPILKSLRIPCSPLPEQKAIAQILSTVDEAIQKTNEIIEKTKKLKKGLMQELLTKGIGHKEFKDTEIGRIPKEWKVVRIEDVAKLESGGTPSRQKSEYWENGTIPWVKSGELNDEIIYDTEEKITESGLKNSSAKMFPKGTLLIALYGATVGKTGILGINASTNQAVCAILPKTPDSLNSRFLQHCVIFLRKNLIAQSSGGAQPNIYLYILRYFKIPLPPFQEQQKIAEILSTVDKRLEIERKRKEKLERIKKALMDLLLTGKIRVKT